MQTMYPLNSLPTEPNEGALDFELSVYVLLALLLSLSLLLVVVLVVVIVVVVEAAATVVVVVVPVAVVVVVVVVVGAEAFFWGSEEAKADFRTASPPPFVGKTYERYNNNNQY